MCKKNTNKKNLLTEKHYQKFPISIISTSTSRNTNKVFPCQVCSKNINDIDAAMQCDVCQFWVHLRCNKLNLVDYKYLLAFAYHVVVQLYDLKFAQYLRKTTLKSSIKTVCPS